MSGGILIHIPSLDRNILPFIPYNNPEFKNTLQTRIEKAKTIQTKNKFPSGIIGQKAALKLDPNYHIINNLIVELHNFVETNMVDKSKMSNYHTHCLMFAGDIAHIMRASALIDHSIYTQNLVKFQRLLKRVAPPPCMPSEQNPEGRWELDAGMDQIIARLNYIMTFEDPLVDWTGFILWHDEYMKCEPPGKKDEENKENL